MTFEHAEMPHEQAILNIADEYGRLFSSPYLSKKQQQRMDQILELAEKDEELDFLISKKTCEAGDNFELQNKENRKSYDDQRAILAEHINHQDPRQSILSSSELGARLGIKGDAAKSSIESQSPVTSIAEIHNLVKDSI